MEKNINWYEVLFYGSKFGEYGSGVNIESIIPKIHYKIYGGGFWKIDVNGNFRNKYKEVFHK